MKKQGKVFGKAYRKTRVWDFFFKKKKIQDLGLGLQQYLKRGSSKGFFQWNFKISSEQLSEEIGFSPSKKICVICLIESPLKMAFYFILNALFVLKIFKFLSRRFGHVGKTSWLET